MDKETLEKEKLKLEIDELKRKPYKKIQFWTVILPSLVALITLLFWTLPSGLLDAKYENLKLEKNTLTRDIRDFKAEKDSLIENLKSLKRINNIQEIKLSKAYRKQEKINIEKLTCEEKIIYYKSRLDSLTTLIIQKAAIIKNLKAEKGSFSSDFNNDFDNGITDGKGNYLTTDDGQIIIAN